MAFFENLSIFSLFSKKQLHYNLIIAKTAVRSRVWKSLILLFQFNYSARLAAGIVNFPSENIDVTSSPIIN